MSNRMVPRCVMSDFVYRPSSACASWHACLCVLQLKQMEVQLEEEYEDKQKVLRERRELESKLLSTQDQVLFHHSCLRFLSVRLSVCDLVCGTSFDWKETAFLTLESCGGFFLKEDGEKQSMCLNSGALPFRWARGMWRRRRGWRKTWGGPKSFWLMHRLCWTTWRVTPPARGRSPSSKIRYATLVNASLCLRRWCFQTTFQ